ncbi:tetratricopeptide repeat protein, partial [Streptomyces clavuligerus]|uniref:tetratricopeptide repeat protein n=1 Tax=Streptomyces clavuligerus TaxID=1901 RepID=UPI001E3A4155
VEARVGHPRYGAGPVARGAQVCWPDPRGDVPSADALDVALLWLDEPVETSVGPVRWGQPGGVAPLQFEGAGFPAFAADTGDQAHFEYLRGELADVSTSSSGWVLDCPVWPAASPDSERPWAGASGAAVFCDGRLVGVVAEDNRAMGFRRLHAVPVHEALSLPGFADLVTRHGHPGTTALPEEVTAGSGRTKSAEDNGMWPVEVGPVPALASAFQPRHMLRDRIDTAKARNGTVVLAQVLSGGGGVGKTQLAAACATDAFREGVDLVVWALATEAQTVITRYAQAATRLQLPGVSGEDPPTDARLLLDWLATTRRRWLVVLDDLTDPAALGAWWPVSRTGTGWVLATTRMKGPMGGGRARVDIDVYEPAESAAYLRERLHGENMGHLLDDQAPTLADALGHLPLALGLAAAYMANEELTCAAYLRRFTDRRTRLNEALPDWADMEGYGRQITTALLLSLDAARATDTTGLAEPVLRLTALLDPAGHPHTLWTTQTLLNHLTTTHTTPQAPQITADHTHSALRLLHRYALLTCDTRAEPRAVRIHALTARAVRENVSDPVLPELAGTAGDALLEIWPEADQPHADLAAVLRANTDALAHHTGDHLWHPEGHTVLYHAGRSLLNAGLHGPAITYWQHMTERAEQLLGDEHPGTLTARANLASSYWQAGRTEKAITILEQVVEDRQRLLGDEHPGTLTARANLAVSYWQAGRTDEAITIGEKVVEDRQRLLGDEHPDTHTARANLASSYWQAGRTEKAITILEQVVEDRQRLLGDEHPDTLTARANLAASYQQAGRTEKAITILEQVVEDRQRLLGDEHPDTHTARANLASSYWQAGRTEKAITILEQVVEDRQRLLGDEHPDTLTARANLAVSYQQAGRTDEAITILEQVVEDIERLLGDEHPGTLTARANLASSYWQAGRTDEAITIEEKVVEDRQRLLGDEHPGTLTARANLAASYQQAGRTEKAITILEQVVEDRQRLLGDEHPGTLTARANLAVSYQQAGRTDEAITILEQVVEDRQRLLGDEHPGTLTARANLAASYQQAGRTLPGYADGPMNGTDG